MKPSPLLLNYCNFAKGAVAAMLGKRVKEGKPFQIHRRADGYVWFETEVEYDEEGSAPALLCACIREVLPPLDNRLILSQVYSENIALLDGSEHVDDVVSVSWLIRERLFGYIYGQLEDWLERQSFPPF